MESETTSTDVKQALGMLASNSASEESSSEEGSEASDDDDNDKEVHQEDDFDLGFDDLDFISTGHQSKSLSMPTIHFGNEDDPSNEPARAATRNATPELDHKAPPSPSPPARQSRTLYMQMEASSGCFLRDWYTKPTPIVRQRTDATRGMHPACFRINLTKPSAQQIDDGITEDEMQGLIAESFDLMLKYSKQVACHAADPECYAVFHKFQYHP